MAGRYADSRARKASNRKGGWSYGENALGVRGGPGDGSNSQFAPAGPVRGGRAAERKNLHISISRETWETRRTSIGSSQIDDLKRRLGLLQAHGRATGSMTCAGISSLVICSDVLHEPDAKVTGDTIDGCYRPRSEDRDNDRPRASNGCGEHFTVAGTRRR